MKLYLGVLLRLHGLKACKHNPRGGLWGELLTGGLDLFQSAHTQIHIDPNRMRTVPFSFQILIPSDFVHLPGLLVCRCVGGIGELLLLDKLEVLHKHTRY